MEREIERQRERNRESHKEKESGRAIERLKCREIEIEKEIDRER